ncbi:uncharacterized protein LOC112012581 [Quercus suber]|uniref:uncharacterized protein LOC112012581 n=1 Tax=Quercus suber TaxID=58331 RepID=UPI0032E003D4
MGEVVIPMVAFVEGGMTIPMDKRATKRRLRLINRESLDRILRSEVFVNPSDGQLRAAHLILKYTPASSTAFQAPKYVIKAEDPRLRRVSVLFEGFVVPEGEPIPEGEPFTEPLPEANLSIGTSSSRSTPQKVGEEDKEKETTEEEEGEEEEEEEEETEILGGFVELPDSADELEVSDRPKSPEATSRKMVIQRRSQRSLKEVIEGQPGGVVEKQVQVQSPSLPPPPPQPSQSTLNEPSDPKRRRESKGKEVMGAGRTSTTSEDEDEELLSSRKQLKKKLSAEEEARKKADSALEGSKHRRGTGRLLHDANARLTSSKEQVLALQKQLEEAQKFKDQAEKAMPRLRGGEMPLSSRVSVIVAEPPEKIQTQALPTLSQQEPPPVPGKEKDLSSAEDTAGLKDGAASSTFEQALASTTQPTEDTPTAQEKDAPQEVAGKAPPKLQIKLTK